MSTALGPDIAGLTCKQLLGSGGYADVFLYEQHTPRRSVAVKVLRSGTLADRELAQFAAEAETMAGLADHPYIVQVFATGSVTDGRPYLVMQYYPGANLGERASSARFSVPDVLRIGVKIASAVETAHRAGILHRDIKPANILVSPYGEPGLTDFGIAGHAADTADDDDIGISLPWAPPEVVTGESNGSVAADVYSLAATVWHLLAGRSPFELRGEDNKHGPLMKRIIHTAAPTTGRPEVPTSLERLLAQGLSKTPAGRPRTALEFARALQAVEHEQRFGRTDIVVAGLGQPQTTSGSPQPRVAPVSPTSPGRESGAPPTTARPARPSSVLSQFAPRPVERRPFRASGPGALDSPPPTAARPALPSRARERRVAQDEVAAGGASTQLRPATPQPFASLAPAPPRRRGLNRIWVIAGGAAVAVAAVATAASLASGGEDQPTKAPTASNDSRAQDPDGVSSVAAPSVSSAYDAAQKRVSFTFTAAAPATGGTWVWWPAGSPSDLHRVRTAGVTLPTADPSTTCIQVEQVSADGSTSEPSEKVCGT